MHAYRQNRFAESMNRSRFPVNNSRQAVRPTPQRASSLPVNPWPASMTPGSSYQQQLTPMATPISSCSPQQYQSSQSSTPMSSGKLDNGFPGLDASHDTDSWDSVFKLDHKQVKQEGLGMSFLDQEHDFGPMTFSATTENFDDLIRLNDHELWGPGSPMSPDRRSLSSISSGDAISDFADLSSDISTMHSMNSDFSSGIEMPILEEDVTASFQPTRRSRSVSRPPAPRASTNRRFRRSPYHANHTRSNSVVSTSSTMSMPMPLSMPATQCCSPVGECRDDFLFSNYTTPDASVFNSRRGSESCHFDNLFGAEEPLIAPKPTYSCDNFFLSSFEDAMFENPPPVILPSTGVNHDQGHSHGRPHGHPDNSDEPDLFGALSEEQSVPSAEDMKPEDPDMEPSEQELRFEGDLYTPRFVRGHGNKREGYCGLCKPGRWLVLKNSAFWYDKSFTHGISAATGLPFDAPKETRRMSGNPDVWEGLCGTCDEWIALISNKKKGTTWFRHAYKVRILSLLSMTWLTLHSAITTKKPKTLQRSAEILYRAKRLLGRGLSRRKHPGNPPM